MFWQYDPKMYIMQKNNWARLWLIMAHHVQLSNGARDCISASKCNGQIIFQMCRPQLLLRNLYHYGSLIGVYEVQIKWKESFRPASCIEDTRSSSHLQPNRKQWKETTWNYYPPESNESNSSISSLRLCWYPSKVPKHLSLTWWGNMLIATAAAEHISNAFILISQQIEYSLC